MSKQYPGGVISKTPVTPTSLSAPGIWTMNQQAAAQATNTWPFPRDPQFNYVTMLLHGDGSAGAVSGAGAGTSSTVTNFNADASTNAFNVVINGDTRSDNFSPYLGTGYYSNYFDGNGDSLTLSPGAAFAFGTGDFTVEAWLYPTVATGSGYIIDARNSGQTSTWSFNFGYGGTQSELDWGSSGSIIVAGNTTAVIVNQWNHVAYTRSGTTGSLYVNGVRIATATDSTNYSTSPTTSYIGSRYSLGTDTFTGYMSNVRVVKGTAVYTGTSYTVPTSPLTAITNTTLLTCQNNRFIDNSTNAFAITQVGDTKVAPAQPFTLPSSVATYGSGYFDGSGDWLETSLLATTFGASNFTVECWLYYQGDGRIYANYRSDPGNVNGTELLIIGTDIYFPLYQSNTTPALLLQVAHGMALNTWNHIAVTRSSSTFTIWINGVSKTTGSYASALNNPDATVTYIGRRNWQGNTNYLTGYLSNFRTVIGTAVYTSAFTPPTNPLTAVSGTSLLTTQYNGGGNNSGFKDGSQFDFPITRNGNTTQGTFTPYGSNWSNYFDGNSDRLVVPANAAFNFSTGDFTVECWFYTNSVSGNQWIIGPDNTVTYPWVLQAVGTAIRFISNNAANDFRPTSFTLTTGTWNHFAVTRSGSTMYWFTNGTLNGTQTYSTAIGSNTIDVQIGTTGSGSSDPVNGYISNLRVVKGTAVYTSSFTPSTTPLTAITNTSLLTCQSNRIIDNSSNAFTITKYNDVSVQRFSPFAPLTVYNPTTNSGSGYFDGNGDYLTAAQNAAFNFGTGAFTVEAWVYITASNGTNQRIIGLGDGAIGGGPYTGWQLSIQNNLTTIDWYRYDGTETDLSASYTFKTNTWYHIVAVRNGSSNLSMYVNGTRVYNNTSASLSYSNVNTNPLYIGRTYDGAGGGSYKYFNGYMTDARIVAGTAVYDPTSSTLTVPTAPLTAITNTSLLLSYTNAGILDNSGMNDLETVGNAAVSTTVKKYGAASMYFDGSGDYLLAKSNDVFNFGTGDFTVEFWINASASGSYTQVVGTIVSSNENGTWRIGNRYNSTNTVYFARGTGAGFDEFTAAVNVNDGSWHHVAVTRASGTVRIFVDGTLGASQSITGTCTTSNPLYVGYNGRDNAYVTGYIDDLRITKGYARYTANFTVPDQAFPNG